MIFILFKIDHLDVSFFWDESWVYAPAIRYMAESGPTLFPGTLDVYFSRGHPLLFHFLGGIWLNIFGTSFVAFHAFALSISIIVLMLIWRELQQLLSTQIAFWSVTFISIQLVFVAQSSMVLPEILLGGLSALSMLAYLNKKYWGYVICCSLALLTKESGLVCFIAVMLFVGLDLYQKRLSKRQAIICLLPIVSFIAFFSIQKMVYGWFFYPEHVSMMSFEWSKIFNNFKGIADFVFLNQNRIYFFGVVLLAILLLAFNGKRTNWQANELRMIGLSVLFSGGYLCFSLINFLTLRYLLSILFVVLPCSVLLLLKVSTSSKRWNDLPLALLTIPFFIIITDQSGMHDVNLSYLVYSPLHKETIAEIESMDIYDETIITHFLPSESLREPYAGYRSTEDTFTYLNSYDSMYRSHYFLIESIESSFRREGFQQDSTASLIFRKEKQDLWYELYYFDRTEE